MKQNYFGARWRHALCTVAVTSVLTLVPSHLQAASFELIFNGSFNNLDALNLASQSSPTFFSQNTPFTIRASFDTSSPNLAPPSPPAPPPFGGFRAYSALQVTIDIR